MLAIRESVSLWKLNRSGVSLTLSPYGFLGVPTDILQRLCDNTRTSLEEMCETLIAKLSNVDGQVDVKSRWYICGENVRKQKQNGSRHGCN